MNSFESIKSAISSKKYPAVAVLYGEEPYFLRELAKRFENSVVPQEAKDFNQHILYGKDTTMGEVIQKARALPMFSDQTLVLVRELFRKSKPYFGYSSCYASEIIKQKTEGGKEN
jgi:DNA polymerase-3 subunit delta